LWRLIDVVCGPRAVAYYVPAARAAFLDANEPVLGLSLAGETRAYPLRMMAWHHVVNDEVGPARQRVAIVY